MTNPQAIKSLTLTMARSLRGLALLKIGCVLFAAYSMITLSTAQTFNTIVNFLDANGSDPYTGMVQGIDGNFYGTTSQGGANYSGTVFDIDLSGSLNTLHSFHSVDGFTPFGTLIQAGDGNFYGTTFDGGSGPHAWGTVFKITPTGTLTTVYIFCSQPNCTDGAGPYAGVIQGNDGNFYGTTYAGGADFGAGFGTVFKLTPMGGLTTLHSFCLNDCSDGYGIYNGVIQGRDGNLYGTTFYGGVSGGYGTFFKITSSGALKTLYNFCSQKDCPDGGGPTGVMQAADGNFYGTTQNGGNTSYKGTVFKITPTGKHTTLYSFCAQSGCPDGANPNQVLIQGTDGNFYGTTTAGGARNAGTIFRITRLGALSTLHSFDGTDGAIPQVSLLQATNGSFYGTTSQGGSGGNCYQGCGTIFNLSVGLAPFVKTQPTSGKVGASVIILGYNLTGTTKVSFNGAPATFQVVSDTEIETTVPAGARTGRVSVGMPGGTLKSNVVFRVVP